MKVKAISLISGGLDSTLATKVVLEQGIDVIAANFLGPFCRCNRKPSGDRRPATLPGPGESRADSSESRGCRHEARFVSEEMGIPLKIINVTQDYLRMLKSPKHGYGSHMNPCIDCRILMLKKAKELMEEANASFVVTGEVMGQRPMSQRKNTMRHIEKEAGLSGLILRPLSAKLLEPTIPEKEGWVDRDRLLSISGRGRKVQMEMAADFNIKDYPCPAGGCLLTDPAFSKRVKDLIDHDELTLEDVKLLQHGRHFRIAPKAKLVVGRNEHDNAVLEDLRTDADILFLPREEVPGASGLGRGDFSDRNTLALAAKTVARYFDDKDSVKTSKVEIQYKGKKETLEVAPFCEEEVKRFLV